VIDELTPSPDKAGNVRGVGKNIALRVHEITDLARAQPIRARGTAYSIAIADRSGAQIRFPAAPKSLTLFFFPSNVRNSFG
jgi:hypothetical protein